MTMRQKARLLLDRYIRDNEGGVDPFADGDMEPRDDVCLWCVRIRLLKWLLGEIDSPDNGRGMAKYGTYALGAPIYEDAEDVPAPPRDPGLVARVLAGEDDDP